MRNIQVPSRLRFWLGLLVGTFLLTAPTPAYAQRDPNAFASLGTLNVSSGTLTIDTDNLTMSGAASFNGVLLPQNDGFPAAVFTFSDINLGSGASVSIVGGRPLILLSQGNASIQPNLSVANFFAPGGYRGAFVGGFGVAESSGGNGPGGGPEFGTIGTGAGHGGAGGGATLGWGGPTYGDLLKTLVGGSSGGATTNGPTVQSSGGGGAIEIGATGSLSVAFIDASAQAFGIPSGTAVGGSAGGGILLHGGSSVTLNGSLVAQGSSGFGNFSATGGGGGRIAVLGQNSYTLGNSLSGFFVAGGSGNFSGAQGMAGVITIGAATSIIPFGKSAVIDDAPIISVAGASQFQPTVEALIRRNLTIQGGGSATLGANEVLRNDSILIVDGFFDTNGYDQTAGRLLGGGSIYLDTNSTLQTGTLGFSDNFAGVIQGAGALSIRSNSSLWLTNFANYTGGTIVQANAGLLGSTNSIQGSISNNGFVDFVQNFSGDFFGSISGAGTLYKEGTGSVTLWGANTHTGPTQVFGGTLRAAHDLAFGLNSEMVLDNTAGVLLDVNGRNVAIGSLAGGGSSGGDVALGSGKLSVGGNHASTTFSGGISGAGELIKTGFGTLTLDGSLAYSGPTTINAGAIELDSPLAAASGRVTINSGGTLIANADVERPISGTATTSSIVANTANITLGSSSTFTGFSHAGTLEVGGNTVTLDSRGFASLGIETTLAGGTINAPNGISLGSGANILGNGAVNAKLAGNFGSTIEATGNLILGDGTSGAGFQSDGELRVNEHTVTIHDGNQAVLGSQVSIGNGSLPGTLNVANGAYLDFGRELTGMGTINSTDALAQAFINNGSIIGNSPSEPVTLTGYVKGVGYFDNVNFTGTFSPGLSPTLLSAGGLSFGVSNTLLTELGGTTRGTQYDAMLSTSSLSLAGTLDVQLIDGFLPQLGDSFDLFDGILAGTFDSILLPSLSNPEWAWGTSQLYSQGILEVVQLDSQSAAIPEPASAGMLLIGTALVLRRRRAVRRTSL